jgi:hypothetical protein
MTFTHIGRLLAFAATFALLYVLAVGVAYHTDVRGRSVAEHVLDRSMEPGGFGQTLRRFRSVQQVDAVDVLFAGSSHAVRAFDPRPYEEAGLRVFNLGSMAQTPLNSFYVLSEQVPRLKPRVLVYELYPEVIGADAVGSGQDLIVNTPTNLGMLRMTASLRSPEALMTLVATQWSRLRTPLDAVPAAPIPGETYVEGGYLEKTDTLKTFPEQSSRTWTLEERQMDYLRRIIALCRAHGTEVLFVSHPLPDERLAAVTNDEEIYAALDAFAREEGVPYNNFHGKLPLRTFEHFYDDHHLNAAGGTIFNAAVLAWLRDVQAPLFQDGRPT